MRTAKDLMAHQRQAIERMVTCPEQAALLKMGLGKTAITEFAILERQPRRALVIAPANVVERDVWGREAREWKELQRFRVNPLLGSRARRTKLLEKPADIDVVSYENLVWLQSVLDSGKFDERWDLVAFDELSMVKTPGSQRFKKLRYHSMDVPVRFGLEGSPVGNSLLDVWGEMFMVAGEKPLGSSFAKFKTEWFTPSNPMDPIRSVWTPRAGAEEHIIGAIKPYAYSLAEHLAAGILPEVLTNPIDLELPAATRDLEARLWSECKAELPSGDELVALNASAKAMKARQLASGAVYYDPLDETKWEEVHTVKLDMLEHVLRQQQGEPVLLFYWFQHERERILKRFPHAKEPTLDVQDAWDRREVPLMLMHPASQARGVNLQKGGSSACWYTLPLSHAMWEQGNGRLARPGQQAPHVVATALCAGEADRAVLELLRQKGSTQSRVMQGVELQSRESLLADPAFG